MADKSNNINPDGEKLLSYYKNELSSDEKHRLEEQMLEDGFMADAAEGLGMVENPAMIGSYIAAINSKFSPAPAPKSPYMSVVTNTAAIAASVTVLIGAAYFISQYVNQAKPTVVAEKEHHKQPSIGPATDGGHTIIAEEKPDSGMVITGPPQTYQWDFEPTEKNNRVSNDEAYDDAPNITLNKPLSQDKTIGYLDYSKGAPPNKSYTYSPNYPDGQVPAQIAKSEDVYTKKKDSNKDKSKGVTVTDNYGQPEGVFIDGRMVTSNVNADSVAPAYKYTAPAKRDEESKSSSAYTKGLANYNKGKYKAALDDFSDVLKKEPTNQKALYYAGVCNSNLAKYDKALTFFNKIPAGSTYYENALWEKSRIYKGQGKNNEAIKTLQEIIKLNGTMKSRAEKSLKELKLPKN